MLCTMLVYVYSLCSIMVIVLLCICKTTRFWAMMAMLAANARFPFHCPYLDLRGVLFFSARIDSGNISWRQASFCFAWSCFLMFSPILRKMMKMKKLLRIIYYEVAIYWITIAFEMGLGLCSTYGPYRRWSVMGKFSCRVFTSRLACCQAKRC